MPSSYLRTSAFPIDFKSSRDSVMQPVFSQVGLVCDEGADRHARARMRGLQDGLVEGSGLFALRRPVFKKNEAPYYHQSYTAAAFRDAPNLQDFNGSDEWQIEIMAHLQDFARQDGAKAIIGEGIAAYYNRIAGVAKRIPRLTSKALIRVRPRGDEIAPLCYFGVHRGNAAADLDSEYSDRRNGCQLYFDIETIASRVGWVIPGIGTAATQIAIREAFEETRDQTLPVDPEQLFMLGRAAAEDTGIRQIFEEW